MLSEHDPTTTAVATDWPAAPSGIPPKPWESACRLVVELAPTAAYYWPVWREVYRRCFRRVRGGAGGRGAGPSG